MEEEEKQLEAKKKEEKDQSKPSEDQLEDTKITSIGDQLAQVNFTQIFWKID